MIKQQFKLKVLCTAVLSLTMLLAVSGVNQVQAQLSTAASGLTESEYQDFKSDIVTLMEETESNSAFNEIEIAVRMYFYEKIFDFVERGNSINDAIYASVAPTVEYTQNYRNPDAVNVEELAEETKDRLQ